MHEVKQSKTEATRTVTGRIGRAIDRAVFAVSPGWGSKRIASRNLLQLHEQRFAQLSTQWEGATKDRLHGDKWLASRLSTDSGLEEELGDQRKRSNELFRNFGFCRGAIDTRVDNVVGKGFRYQSQIRAVDGVISEDDADRFNREIEEIVKRWQPMAGKNGRFSFGRLQRIAARSLYRDGDVLRVFSDVGRADKPVPLQVDLIDANRVETPPSKAGSSRVRMGVEYDSSGDILGYHVRNSDPDDTLNQDQAYTFYDTDRAELIFEPLWAQQSRGIPWFASILNECKDLKDFKEAVIIAAQVQACSTLVISTSNPVAAAEAAANAINSDGTREEDMYPGKTLYVDNADLIQGFNPTQPTTTFGMFADCVLQAISSGLNWPFTWLTKDYRRVNFISGRLGEIDGRMVIRSDQQLLTETFLNPCADRIITEAVITGEVSIDPTLFDRSKHHFLKHNWIGPGRPWVDPREVQANIASKEHNLDTLAGIHARNGLDTEEVIAERGRERAMEREQEAVPPGTQPEFEEPDSETDNAKQTEGAAA
jgi:lambda family phage portal protein